MKTDVMELGYFIDETNNEQTEGYRTLLGMIDDGMILPSLWVTVDEDGEPIGLMDITIGYAEYTSFIEIPGDDSVLRVIGKHGLSFTPAFLERQGVECVQYLIVQEDVLQVDPALWIHDKLEILRENPEAAEFLREAAKIAMQRLKDDPEMRARLRERIAEHINVARTYHEVVLAGEDDHAKSPKEWRSMAPVQFTLNDIQTIYVANAEETENFKLMYPAYQGAFVTLHEEG